MSLQVACRIIGAAVDVVVAAHSLRWRQDVKFVTVLLTNFFFFLIKRYEKQRSFFTSARGQQAHSPPAAPQQVEFPGQDVVSSHLLLSDCKEKAGSFLSQGVTAVLYVGSSQVDAARLQMVPWGQQCKWSSQQTA